MPNCDDPYCGMPNAGCDCAAVTITATGDCTGETKASGYTIGACPDCERYREALEDFRKREEVFLRKGKYHMEQWPDDKEMRLTMDAARAALKGVNDAR